MAKNGQICHDCLIKPRFRGFFSIFQIFVFLFENKTFSLFKIEAITVIKSLVRVGLRGLPKSSCLDVLGRSNCFEVSFKMWKKMEKSGTFLIESLCTHKLDT